MHGSKVKYFAFRHAASEVKSVAGVIPEPTMVQGCNLITTRLLCRLAFFCSRRSPSFAPTRSHLHLKSYPSHFFAVDERALDPEAKVILASNLGSYDESESNDLGWLFGMVPAADAHIYYMNLEVINMGPREMVEGKRTKKLWLSDLKTYAKEDYCSDD